MDNLVCVSDFESQASKILSRNALDYYKSGAGQQTTLQNNKTAFTKLRIRPRFLTNVSNRDLSTTILGEKISIPIGISPTAMQRMAHPGGECSNAKAAESFNTIFTLSTIATSSIEEIAEAAPHGLKWFQLYIYIDRNVTLNLIRRAEKAGFKAIALTVDTPMFGLRLADVRNKFTLPPHLKFANFEGEKSTKINTTQDGSGLNNYVEKLFDTSLTWDDVKWLKSVTNLPVVIKGILTAEDAKIAVDIGVEGIWVSNHGARQVDGVPASIEALPEIVKAVEGKVEVYLDGGVTDGTDVFKALALGAKMVFIGRPTLWGLACNGEEGVKKILEILRKEFDFALALTGCSSVVDIKKEMVVHESYYAKI
ncbi:2-Hydroxyacid oxidase 1 [Onthophagus taurus]|uniref:2-Hydroxyacid oxidase 1 n=1 Tax=Onthophagus taurus TaxID=166361 RepID=UPI000C2085D3|nr:hydroxyacid oxidase 1 [Onthophagus taurus]